LHNEAKLSHNNIANSIFVTASGDWKLAAFHLSGSLRFIIMLFWCFFSSNFLMFSSSQKDLSDLASVLVKVFSKNPSSEENGPGALQHLPRRLHPLYKRLCTKTGKSIMAIPDMLNGYFLNSIIYSDL
jgi:hypothetical protein